MILAPGQENARAITAIITATHVFLNLLITAVMIMIVVITNYLMMEPAIQFNSATHPMHARPS